MAHKFSDVLSTKEFPSLITRAKKAAAEIVSRRREFKADMSTALLREHLVLFEEVHRSLSLASQTIDALLSTDTENELLLQETKRIERERTAISESLLYLSLEMKTWPRERLMNFAKEIPELKQWFIDIAENSKYFLSEPEERIILLKDKTGESVLDRLYTLITSKFKFTIVVDDKKLTLTQEELRPYLMHERRDIRKAAMEAYLVPFTQYKDELAEIYFAVAEDHDTESVELRKYSSPIETRHKSNNLPAAAYEALERSASKHRKLFQEFIKLKEQILKLDKFERWDFNAPVSGLPNHFTYEESKARVLRVFKDFAPWMYEHANAVFAAGRVDVFPRHGKRSGAFCVPMVPGEQALMMLNHVDTLDSLSTMAHELGHVVHETLAKKHSILVFEPPIALAETASTFAEELLFHDLLKTAKPSERLALLCHKLDECIRGIPTQLRYTRFEVLAHEKIKEGCTASDLDALWVSLIKEDYPTVEFSNASVQWRSIPHIFHYPFYCYGYSFGHLLVLALFEHAKKDQKNFSNKFKAILEAGGAEDPTKLLRSHGFDVTSEAFWDEGFAVIQTLLDDLRKLSKES